MRVQQDRIVREPDLVERCAVSRLGRELEVSDDGGAEDVGGVDAELVLACADHGRQAQETVARL